MQRERRGRESGSGRTDEPVGSNREKRGRKGLLEEGVLYGGHGPIFSATRRESQNSFWHGPSLSDSECEKRAVRREEGEAMNFIVGSLWGVPKITLLPPLGSYGYGSHPLL
jgi:hypothetical protein